MIDKNEIKKAFDAFENEDYITSQNILQKQIRNAKNDWLANKLNLRASKKLANKD